jgi:hypothetical protein
MVSRYACGLRRKRLRWTLGDVGPAADAGLAPVSGSPPPDQTHRHTHRLHARGGRRHDANRSPQHRRGRSGLPSRRPSLVVAMRAEQVFQIIGRSWQVRVVVAVEQAWPIAGADCGSDPGPRPVLRSGHGGDASLPEGQSSAAALHGRRAPVRSSTPAPPDAPSQTSGGSAPTPQQSRPAPAAPGAQADSAVGIPFSPASRLLPRSRARLSAIASAVRAVSDPTPPAAAGHRQ